MRLPLVLWIQLGVTAWMICNIIAGTPETGQGDRCVWQQLDQILLSGLENSLVKLEPVKAIQ